MKKRLLVLITVLLMLVGFSVAQAQQFTASSEPTGVLTAGQLNTAQGFIMSDGRICNPRWGC